MSKSNKNKEQSPLVEAVLALDSHFSELTRLAGRIENTELRSDSDFETVQKLMNHFAESAQGVSNGVIAMSAALNESRAQAEKAAAQVAERASQLQTHHGARQKKMEAFRLLGEKVQTINASLNDLRRPEGHQPTDEDRSKISMRLAELEVQLVPLIEEAKALKNEAHNSKMSVLEQSAHSLQQSLQALSKRLGTLRQDQSTLQ